MYKNGSANADDASCTVVLVGVTFTDVQFKRATWDWVQSAIEAATKWGTINAWDTSDVTDMSHIFSKHRDVQGGARVEDGNSKAGGIWNGDVSEWNTAKVTDMTGMFEDAQRFTGDLKNWDVARVTSFAASFKNLKDFNPADLSKWATGNVADFTSMFEENRNLRSPLGLSEWSTASATKLNRMFYNDVLFNSDLSKW